MAYKQKNPPWAAYSTKRQKLNEEIAELQEGRSGVGGKDPMKKKWYESKMKYLKRARSHSQLSSNVGGGMNYAQFDE